jgi:hypothetical protein
LQSAEAAAEEAQRERAMLAAELAAAREESRQREAALAGELAAAKRALTDKSAESVTVLQVTPASPRHSCCC